MSALGKEPISPERPDLTGAFGLRKTATLKPDTEPQNAGTSTPVTPSKVRKSAKSQPASQANSPASTQASAARTAPQRPTVTPTTTQQIPTSAGASRAGEKADRPLPLHMPSELFDEFTERKDREGLSYPTLLFLAINRTHKRLPELLEPTTVEIDQEEDLFGMPSTVARPVKEQGPYTDRTLKVRPSQLQVLADLVQRYKAPSRNHMINVCVRAYLKETP